MADRLLEVLRERWGHPDFLPLQRQAVEAALSGRDCLVVLPTGGGKSLCYQLPAALRGGLVVVVSPLIALMDDQVRSGRLAGLAADALHSNQDPGTRRLVLDRLSSGLTDLLYTSPERLLKGGIPERSLARTWLAAVDEAQCVLQWGRGFRPEYGRLKGALSRIPRACRLALTATAVPSAGGDIAASLGLREPAVLAGHPDRPNLVYRVLAKRDPFLQVRAIVSRRPSGGAIVYCRTRRRVESLTEALGSTGVPCKPYHAGLGPEERRLTGEAFIAGELDVVVATVAFGMGIDRPDVACVVHADAPRSLEHYGQESGRAGRDGLPAECVLLYDPRDLEVVRSLGRMDPDASPASLRELDSDLSAVGRYACASTCRHLFLARHFGAAYPGPGSGKARGCGACDLCLGETRRRPGAAFLYDARETLSRAWKGWKAI
ncbi:MAG: ATP-dependent DNA helicase RecQ [Elusimicrobiota bacterium]